MEITIRQENGTLRGWFLEEGKRVNPYKSRAILVTISVIKNDGWYMVITKLDKFYITPN